MKDLTLNQREQARLQVLNSVMEYQLPRAQAVELLGISALDRLANASYQIVVEGSSYRERLSPHQALLGTVPRILTNNGD